MEGARSDRRWKRGWEGILGKDGNTGLGKAGFESLGKMGIRAGSLVG